MLFQPELFQLHALLPELERVLRMFHNNFMKIGGKEKVSNVDVEDEHKWVPLDQVYPGYMASETLKEIFPNQRNSFLVRCREWYRAAIYIVCWYYSTLPQHEKLATFFSLTKSSLVVRHSSEYETSDSDLKVNRN